ncbi:PDZ domain-containing protein [Bacillus litorisediminis]|uniref:PDZ domain-containing protein n=1 Tax=Bacillus litorisediminis TaxID=2922713 RepID=UPI001FAE7ACE|nr:PDZ domain-containing protein [Bacillus litorisediminis]
MTSEWMVETLQAMGIFFIIPIFYYVIFYAVLMGYRRVKRERSQFKARVYDGFKELRTAFKYSLLTGAALSLVTVVLGVTVSPGVITLGGLLFFLLSFTLQYQLLSPAYVLGGAFIIASILPSFMEEIPVLGFPIEMNTNTMLSFLLLLGLLIAVEGYYILKNGDAFTSPMLVKSKRGRMIGVHEVDRLWFFPLILFVPGELSVPWEWWPIIPIGQDLLAPLILPIPIGYRRRFQGLLTDVGTRLEGKYVLLLGVVITAASFLTYYGLFVSYIIIGAAILGREGIALWIRMKDQSKPSLYTSRNQGLVILSIHPFSPAEKLGLKVGEVVTKVNGHVVRTPEEFYYYLQQNRAYCKLEVLNFDGEMRFVQRALYEGEHHGLGLLFVEEGKDYEAEVV